MWPISIIEIYIYDFPHKLEYNIFEVFHLAPCSTYHLIFLNNTSHCEIDAWNFDISIRWVSLWLFGYQTFYFTSLFLFPSQILVCATGFCSSLSLFIWRFTFCWALKRKQENKIVGRYIGTSLCMSQDQQNHWLIIHGKFKDLFTTITQMSRFFP